MRFKDRGHLEAESRAGSAYWYLGKCVGMCRVLAKHKLYVSTHDISLAPHLIAEGHWEAWVSFLVTRIVERGQRVVDVGANFGYYTVLMAEAVGTAGKVISIEANSYLAQLVWRSATINGMSHVSVFPKAAWAAAGKELELTVPSGFLGSGFVSPVEESGPEAGVKERVQTMAVDDVLDDLDGRVDFVKIDVEGAEPQVLAGMERTIRANPRIKILMEHSENHDHAFFEELKARFFVTRVTHSGGVEPIETRPSGLEMLLLAPRQ